MRTYYIVLDNSQVSLIQPIIIRRYVIGHYSYNIVLIEKKKQHILEAIKSHIPREVIAKVYEDSEASSRHMPTLVFIFLLL
jgi:hypothetical protein